ncbi:MAG: amidohydrolase [Deltaproteobacteria bacterium]|nr:amidohydrolase [Deltaproteobacteria bacterium]MBW2136037.1 amidohydrolase [Deltaproteobacteria bacterium]
MKRISIEEHFTTEEHLKALRSILDKTYHVKEVIHQEKVLGLELPFLAPSLKEKEVERLLDTGDGRIREMDEAGIDMQVLSLVSPGVQVFEPNHGTALAKEINDRLHEAVSQHPERLAGLACLNPQDPPGAAKELERSVRDLGLKGACINSHVKGEYLDDKKYWAIFETAEKLDVPIYIHPRVPSPGMVAPYLDYPMLATAMHGFATEVSFHALRLIYAGVFDRFPGLKIILGHLGEGLPFWLWRLDNIWERRSHSEKVERRPSRYFKENFFVTTSGIFSQPALLCAYLALRAGRILFAVDYPMESNQMAVSFMDEAVICDKDKEKIYHENAESLFGL